MTLYYGIDTNSSTFTCGQDFYIGELGYGTTTDLGNFNSSAAAVVGPTKTYSYWMVQGPTSDPNYVSPNVSTATAWGSKQADAYYAAWVANHAVATYTLFADIEPDGGGWLDPNIGNNKFVNHAVYSGFLNQLKVRVSTFKLGVYSSINSWDTVMLDRLASPATVEWAANYPCNPGTAGCPVCPTTFSPSSFGGLTATIWQYTGTPPYAAGDLNVATSLPG